MTVDEESQVPIAELEGAVEAGEEIEIESELEVPPDR